MLGMKRHILRNFGWGEQEAKSFLMSALERFSYNWSLVKLHACMLPAYHSMALNVKHKSHWVASHQLTRNHVLACRVPTLGSISSHALVQDQGVQGCKVSNFKWLTKHQATSAKKRKHWSQVVQHNHSELVSHFPGLKALSDREFEILEITWVLLLAEPGRSSAVDVSQTIEMVAHHRRLLSMCVCGWVNTPLPQRCCKAPSGDRKVCDQDCLVQATHGLTPFRRRQFDRGRFGGQRFRRKVLWRMFSFNARVGVCNHVW